MINFSKVKKLSRRNDYLDNNRLHWFSSKFSIYFSFIFINLGLSADVVTIIFFITGLIGALFYAFDSLWLTIVGYILFRLHIIFDMSDGDVARYNQSFSIRGSYWDSVIHSIINPLYYISICFSFYLQFSEIYFLKISPIIALSSSVLMSVKNNYYKALFFNNKTHQPKSDRKKIISGKFIIYFILTEVLSIEGFLVLAIIVRLINVEVLGFYLIVIFTMANCFASIIKFFQLSYAGKTFSKT